MHFKLLNRDGMLYLGSIASVIIGEVGQWLVEPIILNENTLWKYIQNTLNINGINYEL